MKMAVSYAPALLAAGTMLIAWGMISHWSIAAVGLLLSGVALWKWIQELEGERSEIIRRRDRHGFTPAHYYWAFAASAASPSAPG